MKAIFAQQGKIVIQELPVPACPDNGVLVQVLYSLISTGTEGRTLEGSKAASRVAAKATKAATIKIVTDQIARKGFSYTLKMINERFHRPIPLGYSCAGKIIRIGKSVQNFSVGDLVCCAGSEFAYHAEFVAVPSNLVARIPEGVSPDEGAFATVASIGIHAIHQAQLRHGENAVVVGLGLIGILTLASLKAFGVKAWGIDINPQRRALAAKMGFTAYSPEEAEKQLPAQTSGAGADAVFVAVESKGPEAVHLATSLCRSRGTIAIVGHVAIELDWTLAYHKELRLVMTRSYGPGRYDPSYELDGVDYPLEYVRFTEKRNMELFLELLRERKLNLRQLITHTFDLSDAPQAYEASRQKDSLGVLIRYPHDS